MSTLNVATAPQFDLPTSLFGYDVVDCAGQGAGSVIYVVSDPQSSQLYALKHVIRRKERDVRFIQQLENEHEVGTRVAHPRLRRIVDMRANRSLLRKITDAALVMELVDGVPIDMQEKLSTTAIVGCFIQVAEALGAMHHAGYIHCDLKPSNILTNAQGEVKIIDLGQACKAGTVKERIQGTPDYMAPEQVKCKALTPRTDVFNFGATMYWALCQRKLPTLFTLSKDENSFLVDDYMAAPHAINPEVPEHLSNFVMECVRTNPLKRPGDMGEVAHRLETMRYSLGHPRAVVA